MSTFTRPHHNDGQENQISFLKPGSGFLALDENQDGMVALITDRSFSGRKVAMDFRMLLTMIVMATTGSMKMTKFITI